jgi:glycosyltransferase 2 family protein
MRHWQMETIGLTDPEWQRMDGAVSTEPAAIDPRDVDPSEDEAESSAGQGPAAASFLREHAVSLVGSVLFVGGLLWLLQQGALPVVPPKGAWVGVHGWAVALYLLAFIVVHLLRCTRWGLLIAEPRRPPMGSVLRIGLIGYAALVLLPFRLGEAARPALLYSRERVPLGTSAGVVGAERIIDGLVLSTLLLVALLYAPQLSPLPDHIGQLPIPAAVIPGLAWAGVAVFGCLSIGMVAFFLWRAPLSRLLSSVVGRISPRLATRVAAAADSVAGGLRFLHDGRTAAKFGALTLLYWGLNTAGIWLLAWGSGLPSPSLGQAVVILGVLGLGLVVPNAPGFFGTFQIAAYSAMVLFFPLANVTSAGAVFVFLLYVMQIVTILLMGGAAFATGMRRRGMARADASASQQRTA